MNNAERIRVIALAAMLIGVVACTQEESDAELGPGATGATATATDTTTDTATSTAIAAQAEEPVRVSLVDYEIQMPSTLPAGPTSFQISNNGSHEHTFVISGNGVEKKLDQPLKPLEVASLDVDLQPGTYQIVCTYEDHDTDHDMTTQLTVTPPQA